MIIGLKNMNFWGYDNLNIIVSYKILINSSFKKCKYKILHLSILYIFVKIFLRTILYLVKGWFNLKKN